MTWFSDFERLDGAGLHNVGQLLAHAASQVPDHTAVAVPQRNRRSIDGSIPDGWRTISYAELDVLATRIARGMLEAGIPPGSRLALMVRPGIEFIALVFGLMRAGMVQVLIDPGMGRKNMIQCLEESQPQGFVGIPLAQVMRIVFQKRFPVAIHNITVGRRWGWGGLSYSDILRQGTSSSAIIEQTQATDQAAVIFTTGSTGPPKGVFYSHEMFIQQAVQIRDFYGIRPGGVDISGFPLFALFNIGMGTTTVIPKMDPTRPADVDPKNIIQAVRQWQANQSFGSPALWNTVSVYCEKHHVQLPTLEKVFSAGAPVPTHVLRRVCSMIAPTGDVYTPYGATEALPVASNSATTILSETAAHSERGAGTCVGTRFPGMQWKVIAISDEALPTFDAIRELPPGEIGELMVHGPVVSPRYVTRTTANDLHKLVDPVSQAIWHRMGDVGYLDQRDRFWFCGRKGHRVVARWGTLYTIPVESIINTHSAIYRSALVGVGRYGEQVPVVVLEPWPEQYSVQVGRQQRLIAEIRELAQQDERTRQVESFFVMKKLPVDIRHNSKIFREQLAVWAARQLGKKELGMKG